MLISPECSDDTDNLARLNSRADRWRWPPRWHGSRIRAARFRSDGAGRPHGDASRSRSAALTRPRLRDPRIDRSPVRPL